MKLRFQYIACLLSLAAISAAPLHAQAVSTKDIVNTAVSAGSFKTLAAALTAAGLVDALKGKGPTLQGSKVNIRFEEGRVKIGDATLVTADIKTTNGLIHVIDKVLIPSPSGKCAPRFNKSVNLSDLTVEELSELLRVIDIKFEGK